MQKKRELLRSRGYHTSTVFNVPCLSLCIQDATLCQLCKKTFVGTNRLPESPDQEDQDNQAQSTKWTILLQQQFPIDPDSSALVLGRVLSQSGRHIACKRPCQQSIILHIYFLCCSRIYVPIFSRESPRYSKSSIFFVMTCVTSLSSSFSRLRLSVALES